MHPVLLHLGSLTIYSYGVLVATGVIVGLLYARHQARRAGVDPERIWNLGIYMVLAALVGAKLWMVVSYLGYYVHHWREIFALTTVQSGGVFYGGLLVALLVAALYVWRQKLRFLAVADIFAAPLALGHSIGRVGCFMAGCCYGKPTTLPWGVTFTSPIAGQLIGTPLGIPLHPTEIYESIAEFINFLLLVWLGRRQKFLGEIFGTYLILYGLERGTIEYFRGDPGRTLMFHGAVSLMQFVSVGLIIAGVWLVRRGRGRAEAGFKPVPQPARR
jgi:phosphatidylglycerol:prolipoprotein diacylglycerol transferase